MNRSLIPLLIFSVLLPGCAGRLEGPQSQPGQHPRSFRTKITEEIGIKYLLYLPDGYGKGKKEWPLILFLHGAGERGDDLELVKRHGPPKLVERGEKLPFIIVSPQCPEGKWWTYETEVLNSLLDHIITHYRVDIRRIYLTGLSMGGYGTWALATEHPERFAAAAPVCGGGIPYLAYRLKDVPVWVFHGARDRVVPVSLSEMMVDALKRNGGTVRFTVYPEAGHDAWTETYDNPELYEWFLEHHR